MTTMSASADLSFEELVKLNHDVKPDMLVEGQTIVLPAGKLSARDKEILQGIGPGTYRTYPVRAGETIEDIISKRNISRKEVDQLNQDANLDNLFGVFSARLALVSSCLRGNWDVAAGPNRPSLYHCALNYRTLTSSPAAVYGTRVRYQLTGCN